MSKISFLEANIVNIKKKIHTHWQATKQKSMHFAKYAVTETDTPIPEPVNEVEDISSNEIEDEDMSVYTDTSNTKCL